MALNARGACSSQSRASNMTSLRLWLFPQASRHMYGF